MDWDTLVGIPVARFSIWLTSALASAVLSDPFRVPVFFGYHGAHSTSHYCRDFKCSRTWKSSFVLVSPKCSSFIHTKALCHPNAVGIQDENLFLQFAVSTLVPFWQPQKYSPNTERHTFPLRELNPMKATWVLGQPCVALGGMWGSVQWELWSHLPLDVWSIPLLWTSNLFSWILTLTSL